MKKKRIVEPNSTQKKQKNSNLELSERNFGHFLKSDAMTTIYVGNLRYTEDEKSLKRMFSKFGDVSYIRIIFDRQTKKHTGIAFIQMPDKNHAQKAISALNGQDVHGRILKVSIAKENPKALKNNTKPKERSNSQINKVTTKKQTKKKEAKKGLSVLFNYLNA